MRLNHQHRELRALLSRTSPCKAISYIRFFDLPPEEEMAVIECDVRGKSITQVAQENNVSPETVKRRRKLAYLKISDIIHS